MANDWSKSLISDLNFRSFFTSEISIFRHYQNIFLERFGRELGGLVIEVGCERKYNHKRFFPSASIYKCTNVARDYDEYADLLHLPYEDNSVDGIVCVSVLEHVFEISEAINEMHRCLKPGGTLLVTVPFAFPHHDVQDFWRLQENAFEKLLEGFTVKHFVHIGGLISSIVENLRRPRGKTTRRYLVYRIMGLGVLVVGGRFDRLDTFPLGFGVVAHKRQGSQ